MAWNVDYNANPNVTRSELYQNLVVYSVAHVTCHLSAEFCENRLCSFFA